MKSREAYLQSECVRWFRLQFPKMSKLLIAIPNGGSRDAREAVNLKIQGVVAGVSDLLLLTPRNGYGCLCIEMKTETGRQSELQSEWQHEAEKSGNKYVLCRSFDQFRTEILNYLN
ncbi:MAG: VRR-NUC domain-containing protein [Lentisphaerota bacterium]